MMAFSYEEGGLTSLTYEVPLDVQFLYNGDMRETTYQMFLSNSSIHTGVNTYDLFGKYIKYYGHQHIYHLDYNPHEGYGVFNPVIETEPIVRFNLYNDFQVGSRGVYVLGPLNQEYQTWYLDEYLRKPFWLVPRTEQIPIHGAANINSATLEMQEISDRTCEFKHCRNSTGFYRSNSFMTNQCINQGNDYIFHYFRICWKSSILCD